MNTQLERFIDTNNLNPDSLDVRTLVGLFSSQMKEAAESGRKDMMINAFVDTDFTIKPFERVMVIDAGGTNLRTCLVHFDANLQPVIEDFRKTSMPGIGKEVSAEQFFSYFADETERLIDKADRIGWCFSYAAEITEDGDGVPVLFSKEIMAPEVIGKHIGKELLLALKKRGHNVENKKVLVMNDTVTTLLAGMAQASEKNCSGCIGFILGTGTNTAIIKGGSVYNIESGQFDFIAGPVEKSLIDSTANPNIQHLEKQISGAYLGTLAHKYAMLAQKEGLISTLTFNSAQTPDVSMFLDGNPSIYDSLSEEDRKTVSLIFNSVIQRAAKLTAATLASAVVECDRKNSNPVLINADGSTYYKLKGYREAIEKYLHAYLNSIGLSAEITNIEDSPTVGSALGALSL